MLSEMNVKTYKQSEEINKPSHRTCWAGCCDYYNSPYRLKIILDDKEIEMPLKGRKGAKYLRSKWIPYLQKYISAVWDQLPMQEWVSLPIPEKEVKEMYEDMRIVELLKENKIKEFLGYREEDIPQYIDVSGDTPHSDEKRPHYWGLECME